MKFVSTRGGGEYTAAECIVKGLSDGGGLFVPERFPALSAGEVLNKGFAEVSAKILSLYIDQISYDKLLQMTSSAYATFAPSPSIAGNSPIPLKKLSQNRFCLELWHGATHAFKDVALSLLPALLAECKRITGQNMRTLILTATSGDTGKAALEGFKDAEGIDIAVLYPVEGVSRLQMLQMQTQQGDNVRVFGIEGNFDDAQNEVKQIFSDSDIAARLADRGYALSSANSINIGRLLPQIAYYYYAYAQLVEAGQLQCGDSVDFVVPSGNFGNILAGYYAKQMGLNISRLVCASNKNNVLTDFFQGGSYDLRREFYKTMSPSMDILISSNLERLVFELCGRNPNRVRELMQQLREQGHYTLSAQEAERTANDFDALCVFEEDCAAGIRQCFEQEKYLIDPHTAIAYQAARKTAQGRPQIVLSTASPAKFPSDILLALGESESDPFAALERLEELSGFTAPDSILKLLSARVLHSEVLKRGELDKVIFSEITK